MLAFKISEGLRCSCFRFARSKPFQKWNDPIFQVLSLLVSCSLQNLEQGLCDSIEAFDRKLGKYVLRAAEAYAMGHFQSLTHLEKWAHEHPTHLAIYTRALAERTKYQDDLELRTYHEVFVLDQTTDFRYLNCHGKTGLLPVIFGTN